MKADDPKAPRSRPAATRILVADDDDALRMTIVFALLDDGFEVEEAASGTEVLARLETTGSDGKPAARFDLIVMDIRMPVLSGFETVRRLRARHQKTPVILMSAFASPETIDEARHLRVPILSKPFELRELGRLALETAAGVASSTGDHA